MEAAREGRVSRREGGEHSRRGPTAPRRREEERVMIVPLLLLPPETSSGPAPRVPTPCSDSGWKLGGPRQMAAPTELPQLVLWRRIHLSVRTIQSIIWYGKSTTAYKI